MALEDFDYEPHILDLTNTSNLHREITNFPPSLNAFIKAILDRYPGGPFYTLNADGTINIPNANQIHINAIPAPASDDIKTAINAEIKRLNNFIDATNANQISGNKYAADGYPHAHVGRTSSSFRGLERVGLALSAISHSEDADELFNEAGERATDNVLFDAETKLANDYRDMDDSSLNWIRRHYRRKVDRLEDELEAINCLLAVQQGEYMGSGLTGDEQGKAFQIDQQLAALKEEKEKELKKKQVLDKIKIELDRFSGAPIADPIRGTVQNILNGANGTLNQEARDVGIIPAGTNLWDRFGFTGATLVAPPGDPSIFASYTPLENESKTKLKNFDQQEKDFNTQKEQLDKQQNKKAEASLDLINPAIRHEFGLHKGLFTEKTAKERANIINTHIQGIKNYQEGVEEELTKTVNTLHAIDHKFTFGIPLIIGRTFAGVSKLIGKAVDGWKDVNKETKKSLIFGTLGIGSAALLGAPLWATMGAASLLGFGAHKFINKYFSPEDRQKRYTADIAKAESKEKIAKLRKEKRGHGRIGTLFKKVGNIVGFGGRAAANVPIAAANTVIGGVDLAAKATDTAINTFAQGILRTGSPVSNIASKISFLPFLRKGKADDYAKDKGEDLKKTGTYG